MSKAQNAKIRKRVMERLKREGEVFIGPVDTLYAMLRGKKLDLAPRDKARRSETRQRDWAHQEPGEHDSTDDDKAG